ncbi:MAG: hemerythrin domain-containing protein [Deltaproteobacteria bacterium]|nr:hemerythrin domain-containing protein [Deltaproteobacteria bacterium]
MDAIRTLTEEHRVILQVVDALEACATRVEREQRVERADVARFETFFREFTDVCHHGKEEDILFAALADSGFPTATGPLAVMRADHDRGRRLVRRIRELAEKPEQWEAADFEAFAGAAHAFAALLRDHIRREDEVLYPMAEEHLSRAQLRQVDELFQLFEEQREKGLVHARLHELAEALIRRYGSVDAQHRPAAGDRMRPVPSCCGF